MLQQTQQSKPLNGMLMRCVLTRSASPAAMKVPSLLPASDTFRQWSRLPSDLANSKSSATTYLLLQTVREHYNKLLCSLGGRATPVHYSECRKRMRALHTNRPSIEVGSVEPMQPAYYVLLLPKEISRCHPSMLRHGSRQSAAASRVHRLRLRETPPHTVIFFALCRLKGVGAACQQWHEAPLIRRRL